DHPGPRPRRDEEGWLHEALAHVAESRHPFGLSNLDARISAYLHCPERYRLVVPDGPQLPCPGTRGAGFLLLRALVDSHGAALLARLVGTGRHGCGNLEAATGAPFAEAFRQSTAAVALAGSGVAVQGVTPLRLDLRRPLGERLLAGPCQHQVSLADGWCHLDVA